MGSLSFSHRKDLSRLKSADPFIEQRTDSSEADISRLGGIGGHPNAPLGYPGASHIPLIEDPAIKADREEEEAFKASLENGKNLILSIDKKFGLVKDKIAEINNTFYIRFDASRYPDVSRAVIYYTRGEHNNYINWDTYQKAKAEQKQIYLIQKNEVALSMGHFSESVNGTTNSSPGLVSLQSKKKGKKKKDVVRIAFETLLPYFIEWFYTRPIVKAALSFFFKKKESSKSKTDVEQMLSDVGIPADIRVVDDELINFSDLTSEEAMGERCTVLLEYVIDCVKGDETYLDANIPFPESILIDEMLLPMEEDFFIATELTHPLISDPEVRAIGQRSAMFNPDSMPYSRQSILVSRALKPIFQEKFLTKIDANLSRILRLLQGWYLDPRTYCCLINILGGLGSIVPKWLYAIRFNLRASIAILDLEHMTIRESLKNILNVIIQSILGGIVLHLHAYLRGWLSKKEHELLASIMMSSSLITRCAPYDLLVAEFKIYADQLTNDLKSLANSLTAKLEISVDRFEEGTAKMEKRMILRQISELMDIFINTWEVGYACGSSGFAEGTNTFSDYQRPPDNRIITSLDELTDAEKNTLGVSNGGFVPPIGKQEMISFLKDQLKLPEREIASVAAIYDDPAALETCVGGFGSNQIQTYQNAVRDIVG